MSGFSKYTCRIFNVETGEVREIKSPCHMIQFSQLFLRLVQFFVYSLVSGETVRLRIDISKV